MAGASGSTEGRQAKSVCNATTASSLASSLGGITEVRIRISVKHVDKVSLADQSFKVLVQVEASWVDKAVVAVRDYRLVEDKSKQNLQVDGQDDEKCIRVTADSSMRHPSHSGKECKPFFHPRLTFANCLDEQRQDTWVQVYHEDKDGNKQNPVVCLRYISLAVFQEEFELAWFPFDRQDLSMILQAGWPSKEVRLVKKPERAV